MNWITVVFLFVPLFAGTVYASFINKDNANRLFNAYPAELGQFPYIVGLKPRDSTDDPVCSGIIIGPRSILTKTWCIDHLQDITIIAGCIEWFSKNCTVYEVESITVHPDYIPFYQNDIAIIKVSKDIEMNDLVQSISVGTGHIEAGTKLLITGWTSWGGYYLSWYNLTAIDDFTCREYFDYDKFMCTTPGYKTAAGDWACPSVINGELVAMNHMAGTYDIHLRLEYYMDFINSVLNDAE